MSDRLEPAREAMAPSRERAAWSTSGYLMLVALVALAGLFVLRVILLARGEPDGAELLGALGVLLVIPVLVIIIATGFYMIQPTRRRRSRCSGPTAGPTAPRGCAGSGRGWPRRASRYAPTTSSRKSSR